MRKTKGKIIREKKVNICGHRRETDSSWKQYSTIFLSLPVENFPPVIVSASDVINATLDGIVEFNITAKDEDTVKFEVINKPESATVTQSGKVLYFSWNVLSSQKVHNFKQQSP